MSMRPKTLKLALGICGGGERDTPVGVRSVR
jgi:hypothetical protein